MVPVERLSNSFFKLRSNLQFQWLRNSHDFQFPIFSSQMYVQERKRRRTIHAPTSDNQTLPATTNALSNLESLTSLGSFNFGNNSRVIQIDRSQDFSAPALKIGGR